VLNGVDAVVVDHKEIKEQIPIINTSKNARYPIMGASFQARAGVARHDGVAWGFARAASNLGVDIIQNCEVIDIEVEEGKVKGVKTTLGDIMADRVGCVSAGHSSVVAKMAGLRLPVESHPLQAFVSEAMKPILHTVVMSNAVHGYVSQSDKGDLVIGAGIDGYNSYAQRGSAKIVEHCAAAILELFPIFSRVRMNRQWGGIVDVCPDACPVISPTKVEGLYFNCGWGTGGFKATPGSGNVFAHTIAQDKQHELAVPFHIDRFTSGALIDEHGAAGVAH
jgi:sarcosine oxidase subunit beta